MAWFRSESKCDCGGAEVNPALELAKALIASEADLEELEVWLTEVERLTERDS